MTRTEFYILLSLFSGEKHGYEIMKQARFQAQGKLKIGPGSLYSTLDRLLKSGLVIESRTQIVQGRKRKYYKISPLGVKGLKSEVKTYQEVVLKAEKLALI